MADERREDYIQIGKLIAQSKSHENLLNTINDKLDTFMEATGSKIQKIDHVTIRHTTYWGIITGAIALIPSICYLFWSKISAFLKEVIS